MRNYTDNLTDEKENLAGIFLSNRLSPGASGRAIFIVPAEAFLF
jgi:hypothetical protein